MCPAVEFDDEPSPLVMLEQQTESDEEIPVDALVFFRPVDTHMNRHTILGDKMVSYEWLIQEFKSLSPDGCRQHITSASSDQRVNLVPHGCPRTLTLSGLEHEVLMRNVYVWTSTRAVIELSKGWAKKMSPGRPVQCECRSRSL